MIDDTKITKVPTYLLEQHQNQFYYSINFSVIPIILYLFLFITYLTIFIVILYMF
jgi:hypothetical protein